MRKQISTLVAALACIAFLSACANPTPAVPTPTVSPSATATQFQTVAATQTLTTTPTPSSPPSPSATATIRRTPTLTATPRPTAGPSPTLSSAQLCANIAAQGRRDIYVIYIHPTPALVWDQTPRYFQVGLCNTIPPANGVPQGKYKIVLNFPSGARGGLVTSAPTQAELKPGLDEVSVGPWVPGLENHLAICVQRAVAETQVMYNDTPDPFYHALLLPDGRDRVPLPIQCGGDYP